MVNCCSLDRLVQFGFIFGGVFACITGILGVGSSLSGSFEFFSFISSCFVIVFGFVAVAVYALGMTSPLSWFGMLNSYLGAGLYFVYLGLISLHGNWVRVLCASITIGVGAVAIVLWIVKRPDGAPTGSILG